MFAKPPSTHLDLARGLEQHVIQSQPRRARLIPIRSLGDSSCTRPAKRRALVLCLPVDCIHSTVSPDGRRLGAWLVIHARTLLSLARLARPTHRPILIILVLLRHGRTRVAWPAVYLLWRSEKPKSGSAVDRFPKRSTSQRLLLP